MTRLVFLLAGWLYALSACAQPLVYAPLPMENARSTLAQNQPLVAYLENTTHLTIRIQHYEAYTRIVQEFAAGKIDLAYLGPLPVLALRAMNAEVEPLVVFREPNGAPHYTCALAAPYDGPAAERLDKSLRSIALALTQPLSTCGKLSTFWLLRRAGIDPGQAEYAFLGSHEAVALALVRGEYTLGGLKTGMAERYRSLGLAVLAQTPPLPGFTLVANRRTLSPEQIELLRNTLLQAPPAALAAMDLGRTGFSPPDPASFRTLEKMLRDTGLTPLQLLDSER